MTADLSQERPAEDPFVSAERKLTSAQSLTLGKKRIKGFSSIHIDEDEFEMQYLDIDTQQLFGNRKPESQVDASRPPFPKSKEWTETFGTLAGEDGKPEEEADEDM